MRYIITILLMLSFCTACEGIDINSASLEKLQELNGVGPVYAERIIEGRPFEEVSELIQIKGIGEKTLEKIKSQGLVCVDIEDDENLDDETPEEEDIEDLGETPSKLIEIKKIVEFDSKKIINLNPQQDSKQTGETIYESNNEKVRNNILYAFSIFLIFVVAVLLWKNNG
jgi:competence ComEA-like helix-hairpin-helix protein